MKLKLLPKLLMGFGSLGLLGGVIGLTGIVSLGSIDFAGKELNRTAVLGLGVSADLVLHFQEMRVGLLKELLAPTLEAQQGARDFLKQNEEGLKSALLDYSPTILDDTDKAKFAVFQVDLADYQSFVQQVENELAGGNKATAITDVFSTAPRGGATLANAASTALTDLVNYNVEAGARVSAANDALASTAILIMAVVTLLGVALSAVLAVWFGEYMVSRPIRAIVLQLERLAQGDLSAQGNPKSLARGDEIGMLSRSANQMAQELNESLSQISGSANWLGLSSQAMGERMEQTNLVVVGISQGIEAANEHVIGQSSSITETAATSQQILKNLNELNQLISEQAANVTQSSASIEQMIAGTASVIKGLEKMTATSGQLLAASDDGKVKIDKVVETMAQVAVQSEKLQEANDVIESIASQTNLLSMNAAIEAAHAGDAGRGFAVVADEIRKLAEVATMQSKEIARNVKSIGFFIKAGAQDSTVASQSFHAIAEQVVHMVEYNGQIKSAMDEQGEGSKQILFALAQINEITARVRDGSVEMLEGSRNINDEMQTMIKVSEQLRTKTNELKEGTHSVNEAVASAQRTSQETIILGNAVSQQVARFQLQERLHIQPS